MRHRLLPALDLLAIIVGIVGAFVLRLDGAFLRTPGLTLACAVCVAAALVIKPLLFVAGGLYRRYWPYAGARDLLAAAITISASSAVLAIAIAAVQMAGGAASPGGNPDSGPVNVTVTTTGNPSANIPTITATLPVENPGARTTAPTPTAAPTTPAASHTGVIPEFPRSIFAIDWLLTLALVGGLRVGGRVFADLASLQRPVAPAVPGPEVKRVLIVGAGEVGTQVARETRKNRRLALMPVGFLDDEPAKWGMHIQDVPVLGPIADLAEVLRTHRIDEVIIAIARVPHTVVRGVVDTCRAAGISSRAVPGMIELLEDEFNAAWVREIDIADLLRRRPVLARPEAGAYLQDRVVLVTGAGGSIGAELCRQVARVGPAAIVLLGHGENSIFDIANLLREAHPALPVHEVIADVRNEGRLADIFHRHQPDVVFHAAAHKHVRLMESHPEEAITNNVLGTRALVDAAVAAGVERFVFVSTDKAVAPTSIMGASKRVAELIVRDAAHTHQRAFVSVRFGNVLGSRGSVVPEFKRQIDRGGPITITHPDAKRFFMTIPEAVYLVLKAGGLSESGELFVLNMGEPVRVIDLAHDMLRLSRLTPDDVPIRLIGLRPGEKLEEALWEPDSIVEAAGDTDVFRVLEPGSVIHSVNLQRAIDDLANAAQRGDALAIHRSLSELIPTFYSRRLHHASLLSA
jgi:FlaA1/EpsC-like NDP-sugar epimerase